MFNALLIGILKVLQTIINVVLLPVNVLVSAIFPESMLNVISLFQLFLTRYIGGSLAYFSNILPFNTRQVLSVYLTFLVGYYSIVWTYHGITSIWKIIQKIKFW